MELKKIELERIFSQQLDTMLCALEHYASNLPQLATLASFGNLQLAFQESLEDTLKQISRIKEILENFDLEYNKDTCLAMDAIIAEAFNAVSKTEESSYQRDMSMIFYAHVIKHIEIAAYRTLKLTAKKLGYKKAKILLSENVDEAKDNDKLFLLISEEYLN